MNNNRINRVSDFFDGPGSSVAFPGSDRVRVTEIFGQEIRIHEIAWRRSDSETPYRNKFGEPRFVVFEFSLSQPYALRHVRYNTHTGAKQVCERLERIQGAGKLPVIGTINLRDDGSYGIS